MAEPELITDRQQRALHLYFKRVSDSLNESGLTIQMTLKEAIDRFWTPHQVKELLYKPIMDAMCEKESTNELTTKEVSEVERVLSHHLAEKFGLHVEFPHDEGRL